MSDVPCNGCRACCHHQLIILMPEDAEHLPHLETFEVDFKGVPTRILGVKDNGDCIHLTETGCGVYEHRPVICRKYDCRKQFVIMTRNERRRMSNQEVWNEARKRLDTLDDFDKADLYGYRQQATKIDAITITPKPA